MGSKIIVTSFSSKADQGVLVKQKGKPDAIVANGKTQIFEFDESSPITVSEDVAPKKKKTKKKAETKADAKPDEEE